MNFSTALVPALRSWTEAGMANFFRTVWIGPKKYAVTWIRLISRVDPLFRHARDGFSIILYRPAGYRHRTSGRQCCSWDRFATIAIQKKKARGGINVIGGTGFACHVLLNIVLFHGFYPWAQFSVSHCLGVGYDHQSNNRRNKKIAA